MGTAKSADTAKLARKVARRIRACRRRAGMTQVELAWRMRTAAANISRLESGRNLPNLRTLFLATRAFGVSLSELLKGI